MTLVCTLEESINLGAISLLVHENSTVEEALAFLKTSGKER